MACHQLDAFSEFLDKRRTSTAGRPWAKTELERHVPWTRHVAPAVTPTWLSATKTTATSAVALSAPTPMLLRAASESLAPVEYASSHCNPPS